MNITSCAEIHPRRLHNCPLNMIVKTLDALYILKILQLKQMMGV